MKELQNSLDEIKFEYESKIFQLNDKLEIYTNKNKENEEMERRTKSFLMQIKEKDEIIKELQKEIEKYKIIKKNCYLLANEIEFQ